MGPWFHVSSCAAVNVDVLAFEISVSSPKLLVIVCAIRAGANLCVLVFKISVLRRKLVIICATRAGANFGVLGFKIEFCVKYWLLSSADHLAR